MKTSDLSLVVPSNLWFSITNSVLVSECDRFAKKYGILPSRKFCKERIEVTLEFDCLENKNKFLLKYV